MEQFKQVLPDGLRGYWWVIVLVAALIVLLIVRGLLRSLFGGKAGPAQERGVDSEDLASYPPPPAGSKRVLVEGVPARLRLVIVATVGKQSAIDPAAVEGLLDQFLRGLGALAKQDRPRVRVWPSQLSSQGFGPTFHRQVQRPEPDGKPSRWILVAGQTPPRPRPLLLGLALWADEPNSVGRLTLKPEQWAEVVRVQA